MDRRKPRLLLVPNHSVVLSGGMVRLESAEAELVRETLKHVDAVSLTAFCDRRPISSLAGSLDLTQVEVYPIGATSHEGLVGRLLNYVSATLRLPLVIARHDVVYLFCPGYVPLIASVWAKLLARRYGFYIRGTWLTRDGRTPWPWRLVFRRAEFMIVTGEAFRRRLSHFPARILNEVPLTELRPVSVDELRARRRDPISRVLFAGRLARSKGVLDVIRAIAHLHAAGFSNVTLTIAGGGYPAEMAEIEHLAREQGVWHALEIVGHVPAEKLAALYASSDVFVFPSYFAEGFPRVLYEAMMFGMPIVTTAMPGVEGFLADGINCIMCRPSDSDSVASAVRQLIADPERAAQCGSRAHADVCGLYASFEHASHAEQLVSLAVASRSG